MEKAVNPISDEVKQYIATLVESDMSEMAEEILMMDVHDIVDTALDFVEGYPTNNGIRVEIALENLTGLIESITSMVNHSPSVHSILTPILLLWTLRLLAEKVVELEIAPAVSHTTIAKTLKKRH